jgi:hypothetical protein
VLWDCYGSSVDSLACVPSWNFISKKSSRTFYDTRTHFAALARACFHESHVWDKSLVWVCCACVEERLAHRYARTRRAIPMLVLFFFFFFFSKGYRASSAHAIASWTLLVTLPLRGFSPPVPGSNFLSFFLRVLWGRFFVNFWPLEQLFRHLHHHRHVINIISSSKFVLNTSWSRQNSSTHEKWSKMAVFEGLEKGAQNGCFLPVFDLIEKSRFLTSTHH